MVGKAQATKSNLHYFRHRCLVVALIDVSEVLSQTLHACMSYERKKNLKIVWSSKYNWLIDGPNCNCCSGERYGHGQLDVRGIPYASKRQSTPFSWHWRIFWSEFVHWRSIRSVSVTTASEKFLSGRPAREVSSSGRAIPYTNFRTKSRFLGGPVCRDSARSPRTVCWITLRLGRRALRSLCPQGGFVASNSSV